MISLDLIVDALIGGDPTPVLLLIDEDGTGNAVPLVGIFHDERAAHPVEVLAALPVGAGRQWHAVAVLVNATARDLDTGEPIGRAVMAMAVSRTGSSDCLLWDRGVTRHSEHDAEGPTAGAIPAAARAFLAGEPIR